MSTIRIATENPFLEQWRIISQLSYESNINKFIQSRVNTTIEESTVQLISGCIRQAEAYFQLFTSSPLDISPLILYYGSTNLLMGISALISNGIPEIINHGMRIKTTTTRVAEANVIPVDAKYGGLQKFAQIINPGITLVSGSSWSMSEILASIPDLKKDYEEQNKTDSIFTIPIEIVITDKLEYERIELDELHHIDNIEKNITSIEHFHDAYLVPQITNKYVILYRKTHGSEIGEYSISGRKYLQLPHIKNGKCITPNQTINMIMGLYILGYLSRYKPEIWNPFVQKDETGERSIIEKFLFICHRYFPNLVINYLYGSRVQFVNQTEGITDVTKNISKEEIRKLIQSEIENAKRLGK